MVTTDQLAAIMPTAGRRIEEWANPLNDAMARFEINTPIREAMFLANVAEETGELRARVENLKYSPQRLRQIFPRMFPPTDRLADVLAAQGPEAIANYIYADANRPPGYRMGNTQDGDGWKYRGRGPLQLTGRGNYERLFRDLGMPVDTDPDWLLSPSGGAISAAHFWHANGCNEIADRGDFYAVVKRVNGGHINMAQREHYYARARTALGL